MEFRIGNARPRGIALFVALAMVAGATTIVVAVLSMRSENVQNANSYMGREHAHYLARSGTDLVVSEIWGGFNAQKDKPDGKSDFREYLDQLYVWPTAGEPLNLQAYNEFRMNNGQLENVVIIRHEIPAQSTTSLSVTATARSDLGVRISHTRVIDFGPGVGEDPNPFEFAILTRNVTCSVCHLKVQNATKTFALDDSNLGMHKRVKVGALDNIKVKTVAASTIEGTLYSRGKILQESGALYNQSNLSTNILGSVKFKHINSTPPENATPEQLEAFNAAQKVGTPGPDGTKTNYIYQDPNSGATVADTLYDPGYTNPASPDNSLHGKLQTLYADYSAHPEGMVDGTLPSDFPVPFPDNNSDRKVNQQEFNDASTQNVGSLIGGHMYVIPSGQTYESMAATNNHAIDKLPPSDKMIDLKNIPVIDQAISGNLILIGTKENPISISDRLYVDGDVIIKGYVVGNGSIWAKGNVYVPNDLQYANKTVDVNGTTKEVFGEPDLTKHSNILPLKDKNGQVIKTPGGEPVYQNTLGLIAGGNILLGDYLSWVDGATWQFRIVPEGSTRRGMRPLAPTYDPGQPGYKYPHLTTGNAVSSRTMTGMGFVTQNMALFNRDEWSYTKENLIAQGGATVSNVDDKTTQKIEGKFDPDHKPRYYVMNESDDPLIFTKSNMTGWDTNTVGWTGAERPDSYANTTKVTQAEIEATGAVKVPLNPTWISNGNMWRMLVNEEHVRGRPVNAGGDGKVDEPMRIDGLLYSSNAIFAMQRFNTHTDDQKLVDPFPATEAAPNIPVADLPKDVSKLGTDGNYYTIYENSKKSSSWGSMVINGGIVAPDMGILIPKFGSGTEWHGNTDLYHTFTVNWDERVKDLIQLPSKNAVGQGWRMSELASASRLLPD